MVKEQGQDQGKLELADREVWKGQIKAAELYVMHIYALWATLSTYDLCI